VTAPTISIQVDTDAAISLNSGSILTTEYRMSTPDIAQDTLAVNRDRQDVGVPSYLNVTESLALFITGATAAAIQASVQSIQTALDRARQSRRIWGGTRVWLIVQTAADSETWRSEILAGRLELLNAVDQIGLKRMEATLIITRRPYWEGALTALLLTTALTGETTDLVTLYNADDAGAATVRNWINIGATRVTGELPTPLKLRIENANEADQSWAQMFVCNYVFMDPENVDPIMLGSNAVDGSSETWGGDGESKICRFGLTAAMLTDYAGQYCRVLANFTSLTANTWVRVRVDFSTDATTFSTIYYAPAQARYQAGGLIDLGCVPLPPFGFNANSARVYVTLTGQLVGGWSATVGHVQICPTGHGLFRRLDIGGDTLTLAMEDNDAVVDDGPEKQAYIEDATDSTDWPVVRPYYAPILVWPGKVNRLRVLVRTATSFPAITLKAKAWFRPRRLSI
jgi:hypothetical protein